MLSKTEDTKLDGEDGNLSKRFLVVLDTVDCADDIFKVELLERQWFYRKTTSTLSL